MNYLAKQNPQKLRDKADKLCKTILKNMDILQELLNNINAILQIEEADNERDKKNGNSLNLFSSLNLKTSELIHSRMIAELLNPNSSHGKGSIFLKKFIELHDFEFTFDVESASVSTEFDIGPISKNFSSGGRIDILIKDANNHALIIENKIYAKDQKNQLLRYANYAKSKKYDYCIVYLTLDCHEPPEYSTGKNPDYEYVMFSYEDDILPWLNQCMKLCPHESTLNYSLFQYSQCLKDLLNLMNEEYKKAIIDIATDDKNVKSVLALYKIQFLKNLGFQLTNEIFAENSKYFRNSLVRANYTNMQYGISETTAYLERFFRNLLMGEQNELKSRYMIVGTKWEENKKEDSAAAQDGTQETAGSTQETN